MDFKKIKSLAIYYFSGTGNTFFISDLYKKNFLLKSISVDFLPIESIEVVSSQGKYDMLVIAFPVHAFKAPKMVEDFVKSLPLTTTNKPVLLLASCGGMPGSSFSFLRKILLKKGYHVASIFYYSMPNNVSFMFSKDLIPEEEIKQKIYLAKEKIENDFNKLYKGEEEIIKSNIFVKAFSNIVFYFLKKSLKKNKWVVDMNKCTLCEICSKNCPTQNITVKKQKNEVKFSDKCIMCTKCYNFCPVNAINYKSEKTKDYRRYFLFRKDTIKK